MTADQVIALRKHLLHFNYAPIIPEATVLADRDWLNYVRAMAASIPKSDIIVWPTVEEAAWAWPEGLLVVLEEPVELLHTIISTHGERGEITEVEPHPEPQTCRAMVFGPMIAAPVQSPEGEPLGEAGAVPVAWIGDDPTDIVTGWWMPGTAMHAQGELAISESARFAISTVTALGHRLTKISTPPGWTRAERRRRDRDLPGLRVLSLTSGGTASQARGGKVEWSHRWMVRGHWRLQACGPRREQRRLIWIDPFIKGPDDKPFDARPTIWRTGPEPS